MKRLLLSLFWLAALQLLHATPIDGLLERIDPGASKKFKIEKVNSTTDFFELDQAGRRVVVRGNTWVNIGVGLNWYLKYYAGIHLSWNQMKTKLPEVLPAVATPERHETNLTLRYDFNYCTFSYSMAFWDWQRWQQEIDWMVLHGVNMPLAIVGEECVWRNMLLKLGYSEEEIGKFIAGPAFLAWWAMNNLEGWGGPLPLSWYARQEQLHGLSSQIGPLMPTTILVRCSRWEISLTDSMHRVKNLTQRWVVQPSPAKINWVLRMHIKLLTQQRMERPIEPNLRVTSLLSLTMAPHSPSIVMVGLTKRLKRLDSLCKM